MIVNDSMYTPSTVPVNQDRTIVTPQDAVEEIVSSLAIELSKVDDVIIPLSGGVQSTFVAAVAAAAGVEATLVHVKRPGDQLFSRETKNANEVSSSLKLPYRSIAVNDDEIIAHVESVSYALGVDRLGENSDSNTDRSSSAPTKPWRAPDQYPTSRDVMNNVIWSILNKNISNSTIVMGSGFNILMGNGRGKNSTHLNNIVKEGYTKLTSTVTKTETIIGKNSVFVPSLSTDVFDSFGTIGYNVYRSTNIVRQACALLGVPDQCLKTNHISPMDSLSIVKVINLQAKKQLESVGDHPRDNNEAVASLWIRK